MYSAPTLISTIPFYKIDIYVSGHFRRQCQDIVICGYLYNLLMFSCSLCSLSKSTVTWFSQAIKALKQIISHLANFIQFWINQKQTLETHQIITIVMTTSNTKNNQ